MSHREQRMALIPISVSRIARGDPVSHSTTIEIDSVSKRRRDVKTKKLADPRPIEIFA